jgi:hypothetical protein
MLKTQDTLLKRVSDIYEAAAFISPEQSAEYLEILQDTQRAISTHLYFGAPEDIQADDLFYVRNLPEDDDVMGVGCVFGTCAFKDVSPYDLAGSNPALVTYGEIQAYMERKNITLETPTTVIQMLPKSYTIYRGPADAKKPILSNFSFSGH